MIMGISIDFLEAPASGERRMRSQVIVQMVSARKRSCAYRAGKSGDPISRLRVSD